MSGLNLFLTMHTASVETFMGHTAIGDAYASPVTVKGFLTDALKTIAAPGGTQIVSKTAFHTSLSQVDKFTPNTRVTCNGQIMAVDSVRRNAGSGPLAPAAHLEVDLK